MKKNPTLQIWIVLVLWIGLCAAPQAAVLSAADGMPELFLEANAAQAAAAPREHAVRARTAALNRAALAQVEPGGAPVRLSFFPDAAYSAVFSARQEAITGGYTLSGTLQGLPDSAVTLSVQDGTLFASIHTGTALFRARSGADGLVLIEQLDAALPAVELEPLVESIPAETLGTPGGDDDGTRLDVLVVYTSRLAGYYATNGFNLNTLINTAVTETNQGYANSQVNQRVNLAGTMQVTWDEAGLNWSTTLSNLRNGVAPFENVAATRDAVRADLVTLLVLDYNYTSCGIGYLMTTATLDFHVNAYTVVGEACATGYYSFAHEQGHNEGAHHDRWTVDGGTVLYPYAYGFWMRPTPTSLYTHRTIMAYDCYAYQGVSCTRVNYWSNPAVSYSGMPTGIAAGLANAADNHLTLNNTAPLVAKFRDGLPPNTPTGLTVADTSTTSFRLNWTDASSDEVGFKIFRASRGGTDWTSRASTPAGVATYTDSGLPAGVNYDYKVLAYSGNGSSAYSNVVSAIHMTAPTNLVVTPVTMIRNNLAWSDIPSETGYMIERSDNNGVSWSQIAVVGQNSTSYSDASLVCGVPKIYLYRIRGYNAYYNSSYSSNASVTSIVCTAPAVPSPAVCSSGKSTMTTKWTNVDGETRYDIEYKKTSSPTWISTGSVAKDVTSLWVEGLIPGTSYDFHVRSHNDIGDSAYTSCTALTKTEAVFLPAIRK